MFDDTDPSAATVHGQFGLDKVLQHRAAIFLYSALALTGLLVIAAKVVSFARFLLSAFVLPGTPLRTFGPKGSWAVITGASDGIGKEFALQLAAAGFNTVLVSRTPEKLAVLAAQIASTHAVATHALAMDFAAPDAAAQAALAALLAPLDIAILINNVGRSHAMPVPFALTEPAERDAIIEINCASTLRTTALVLPGMLARRRGLVLTMGSFAALVPTPLLATYSGSKAFLQHWSTALGAEVAAQGVVVELVQSYLVTSAMSKVRRPSLLVPAPRAFVRSVLAKLGRSGGAQGWAYTSTPFWSHGAMQWALGATVGFMGRMAVRQNMVLHESIRKRALRKVQREAGAGKKGN